MSMVNKFMSDMCNEIAENFSGKDFTVNDLMEHFNEMSVDSSSGSEDEKPVKKKAKKAKKEKKPKDPNAPKKPTNSYMYFSQHTRAEAEGDTKYSAKQLGAMWAEVDSDTKETFDKMAKKDNDRYKKEKAEYDESNQ